MKPYSNLERSLTQPRAALAVQHGVEPQPEQAGPPSRKNGRVKESSLSDFAGDDSSQSSAETAQRDLDAALQLLADRAQYITGAGGAAIALRREGRNDMLCRASAGSNAPELGALLSAEFGLSGESVRTRQPLRCDDAERDPRVNREGCRLMGIASVIVMPIVHDDQVVGVFELFSGKAKAFVDRDLAALKRLSEMAETAVKLAHSAEGLTGPARENNGNGKRKPPQSSQLSDRIAPIQPSAQLAGHSPNPPVAIVLPSSTPAIEPAKPVLPKKPLFWSAALIPSTEKEKDRPAEPDHSHVPAVLRNLRKCQACGFPVSEARALCVECEEKKWRGKLKVSRPVASTESAKADSDVSAIVSSVSSTGELRLQSPSADQGTAEAAPGSSESIQASPILSGGLAEPESWFSRHKYIVGVILAVAGSIVVVALLR